MKQKKLGRAGIALAFVLVIGGVTALPILALGIGSASPPSCAADTKDGTPTILGPSGLTSFELREWWAATGRGQPSRLKIAVNDVIALYLSEGDIEGVRGDIAFAQAIVETGHFTNSDTATNNYAGIGHHDGSTSGIAFADPVIGVRAQIQLLKKYAAGNDTALARPDVAPDAGATATTWGGLAGTWSSSPDYWSAISSVYITMVSHAGSASGESEESAQTSALGWCPIGDLVLAGGYALPLERRWYEDHPDWFTRPHHDYPAIDIPVPVGTPLFAVTNGVVVSTPTSGRCGIGVVLNGDDGAQYTYCHGRPGTQAVTTGERVPVGHYLLDSASTGNSTGPHLHFGIQTEGARRCPQSFLVSIAEGAPIEPQSLPTAGCTS